MSTQGVGNVNSANTNVKTKKSDGYTVRAGETVTNIAKKFGMSTKEFINWAGLKSSNLKAGQKIALPTDSVPQGKGILALARNYGMTLDELCKLNNIPKTYNPAKGEVFYVKKKQNTESATANRQQNKPKQAPVKQVSKAQKSSVASSTQVSTPVANNMSLYGSSYTPNELSKEIFNKSGKYYGAVGKPDFDALIEEINSKNVGAVIEAYVENPENKKKESLINTITSEVSSNKDARKKAVMHIYDKLAEAKNTPAEHRVQFETELNDQFDSWGMVNTTKMDQMLKDMLNGNVETKPAEVKPENKKSAPATSKKAVSAHAAKPNEKVIKGGFITAVGGQFSVASTGAKPPIPVDEKGNVIAEVIKFTPSNPKGPLKGKTIMVNAGHGWKESKVFDQGTSAVDVKGKTIPEWYKNRNFADKLISQLSAQGATVIYTSGGSVPVCNAKKKYKADMLISLHCNAAANNSKKNGLEVFYPEGSEIGIKFAKIAERNLDTYVSFGKQGGANDHCKTVSDITTRFKKLGILQLNKNTTPSILIEMGYQSNEKDLKNIDWKEFQEKTMSKLVDSVKEYYKIK